MRTPLLWHRTAHGGSTKEIEVQRRTRLSQLPQRAEDDFDELDSVEDDDDDDGEAAGQASPAAASCDAFEDEGSAPSPSRDAQDAPASASFRGGKVSFSAKLSPAASFNSGPGRAAAQEGDGDGDAEPADEGESAELLTPPVQQKCVLQFSTAVYYCEESEGAFQVDVVRIGPATHTVYVHYTTENGSALTGQNYVETSGTLVFAPGVVMRTATVPVRASEMWSPTLEFSMQLTLHPDSEEHAYLTSTHLHRCRCWIIHSGPFPRCARPGSSSCCRCGCLRRR